MQIHGTDVIATAVIAAGIVMAHTVTDALCGSPEFSATIWVDSDHDPVERLRLQVGPRAPLPPAPVPPPPGFIRPPAEPDVFRLVPIDPNKPDLGVIHIKHHSPGAYWP